MSPVNSDDRQPVLPRRFAVNVERDHLLRFAKSVLRAPELPTEPEPVVPITYLATWFGLPEVEALVLDALGSSFTDKRSIVLHFEQHIEMTGALRAGESYFLDIEDSRLEADGKLIVSSRIRNLAEEVQVKLSSTFIKVETGQFQS